MTAKNICIFKPESGFKFQKRNNKDLVFVRGGCKGGFMKRLVILVCVLPFQPYIVGSSGWLVGVVSRKKEIHYNTGYFSLHTNTFQLKTYLFTVT